MRSWLLGLWLFQILRHYLCYSFLHWKMYDLGFYLANNYSPGDMSKFFFSLRPWKINQRFPPQMLWPSLWWIWSISYRALAKNSCLSCLNTLEGHNCIFYLLLVFSNHFGYCTCTSVINFTSFQDHRSVKKWWGWGMMKLPTTFVSYLIKMTFSNSTIKIF